MRKFFNYFLIRFFNIKLVPIKPKKLTQEQKDRIRDFWQKVEAGTGRQHVPKFETGGVIISDGPLKFTKLDKDYTTRPTVELLKIMLDNEHLFEFAGLCRFIRKLNAKGILNDVEMLKINDMIPCSKGYVWPPGEWEPRAEWIKEKINMLENGQDQGNIFNPIGK